MDDSTNNREPMLDMFVFETNQLIEQLEEIMLEADNSGNLTVDAINEIFRIMHTIKGSSAMMMFNKISQLAHSVEDLFFYIRENKPEKIDISITCDLVLAASDFIKQEVVKVDDGKESDGDETEISEKIKAFLTQLSGENGDDPSQGKTEAKQPQAPQKQKIESFKGVVKNSGGKGKKYIAQLHFEDGGKMENVRAFTIYRNLEEITSEIYSYPIDVINASEEFILENGFVLLFETDHEEKEIKGIFEEALFLKSYEYVAVDDYLQELIQYHIIEGDAEVKEASQKSEETAQQKKKAQDQDEKTAREAAAQSAKPETRQGVTGQTRENAGKGTKLSLISVNVNKLDGLMNLVGELVISESMVTRNPDLNGLQLENFNKASRQLRKLTDELQDIVMSIRMVPIAGTFQKMQRIVRDMSRKLKKDVEFVTDGEDTEVDKNIIDHLSDPLMHLIRNAMDHGVESEEERISKGKAAKARISLTAQNTGGDVIITVSDDGKGLDKKKILKKARENGLLTKPESAMTDNEIFSLILLPGFSTNEKVTEYSGRGVGMDVVRQNIEEVGGSISIKSAEDQGTTMSIVIPLTLAIADAMELSVGECIYTLPTVTIKESFRPKAGEVIHDNDGHEMIMIRGNVYPIIRLHEMFKIPTAVTKLEQGILIMIEGNNKAACLFADMLIGEQQVVVKPLPSYLNQYSVKEAGIEGCTILGNGNISLILNAKGLISRTI